MKVFHNLWLPQQPISPNLMFYLSRAYKQNSIHSDCQQLILKTRDFDICPTLNIWPTLKEFGHNSIERQKWCTLTPSLNKPVVPLYISQAKCRSQIRLQLSFSSQDNLCSLFCGTMHNLPKKDLFKDSKIIYICLIKKKVYHPWICFTTFGSSSSKYHPK